MEIFLNRFTKDLIRSKEYHPISSPGMMYKLLPEIKGNIILDVGYGAGLLSHIIRTGWYHTFSYKIQNIQQPIIIGLDVNEWNNLYNHNYNLLIRGNADKISLRNKCVHTLFSIENAEHQTEKEFEKTILEFERLALCKIIITTPSPLFFMYREVFIDRLIGLVKNDIFIDFDSYLILVSAVHKHCLNPIKMKDKGYEIKTYHADLIHRAIYIKEFQSNCDTLKWNAEKIKSVKAELFTSNNYAKSLEENFPLNIDRISHYSKVDGNKIKEQINKCNETSNYKYNYINIITYSLDYQLNIPDNQKNFFKKQIGLS